MLYCDTSLLVKLYVLETDSLAVAAALRQLARSIVLTPLHRLELVNAIERRVHLATLTPKEALAATVHFSRDAALGYWFESPAIDWPAIFRRAGALAQKHTPALGARSLDLLHVATALELKLGDFATADTRQARIAEMAGLKRLKLP